MDLAKLDHNLSSVLGGHYAGEVDGLGLYQVTLNKLDKPIRSFVCLAYQGKDIVFRFIIEYRRSLGDFGP
jgi:hypothetical protein